MCLGLLKLDPSHFDRTSRRWIGRNMKCDMVAMGWSVGVRVRGSAWRARSRDYRRQHRSPASGCRVRVRVRAHVGLCQHSIRCHAHLFVRPTRTRFRTRSPTWTCLGRALNADDSN